MSAALATEAFDPPEEVSPPIGIVFVTVPGVEEVRLIDIVHDDEIGIVPPESEKLDPPAVAVTVPPQVLL